MIELRWIEVNEQPALLYEFYRGWTWRDFNQVKQRADALLVFSSVKIPLIFDLSRADDMPPGMITHTRSITETRNPNGSPVVIVGASTMIRNTFNIVQRMMRHIAPHMMDDVIFVRVWDDIPQYLHDHILL